MPTDAELNAWIAEHIIGMRRVAGSELYWHDDAPDAELRTLPEFTRDLNLAVRACERARVINSRLVWGVRWNECFCWLEPEITSFAFTPITQSASERPEGGNFARALCIALWRLLK